MQEQATQQRGTAAHAAQAPAERAPLTTSTVRILSWSAFTAASASGRGHGAVCRPSRSSSLPQHVALFRTVCCTPCCVAEARLRVKNTGKQPCTRRSAATEAVRRRCLLRPAASCCQWCAAYGAGRAWESRVAVARANVRHRVRRTHRTACTATTEVRHARLCALISGSWPGHPVERCAARRREARLCVVESSRSVMSSSRACSQERRGGRFAVATACKVPAGQGPSSAVDERALHGHMRRATAADYCKLTTHSAVHQPATD